MSFDKEISREDQDEINNFTKYFCHSIAIPKTRYSSLPVE